MEEAYRGLGAKPGGDQQHERHPRDVRQNDERQHAQQHQQPRRDRPARDGDPQQGEGQQGNRENSSEHSDLRVGRIIRPKRAERTKINPVL